MFVRTNLFTVNLQRRSWRVVFTLGAISAHICVTVARNRRNMLAFFHFLVIFFLISLTENIFCALLCSLRPSWNTRYDIQRKHYVHEVFRRSKIQQIQDNPRDYVESALKGTISSPRHWLTQRRKQKQQIFAKGTTSSFLYINGPQVYGPQVWQWPDSHS